MTTPHFKRYARLAISFKWILTLEQISPQRAQMAALQEELSQESHKDTLMGLREALATEHPKWQSFLDNIRERSGSQQVRIVVIYFHIY